MRLGVLAAVDMALPWDVLVTAGRVLRDATRSDSGLPVPAQAPAPVLVRAPAGVRNIGRLLAS
ncbi:hypothetical protein GCM10027174_40640 [Salinifilum aidingensis]